MYLMLFFYFFNWKYIKFPSLHCSIQSKFSGKISVLKKFKDKDIYREAAEVFEDETATQDEVKTAGLKMLIER